MVCFQTQLPGLTKIHTQLLFPVNPPDAVEVDFSHVSGPLPVQAGNRDVGNSESAAATDVSEIIHEDPVANGDGVKVPSVGIEDFEVLKVIGQGYYGRVYQVREKHTSEIYAMKVVRKDRVMDNTYADTVTTERNILKKIDHPFIVQLKFSFQTKYRLYFVLDIANGGTLWTQLYNHGLFKEDLARVYAAELVSAISHLHENGIMHRDLKPDNVLLDGDGHVKVTDFGLSKIFDGKIQSYTTVGTPEYMSPENLLGKGYDQGADWWSVGIIIFEMLTGKLPYVCNRAKYQDKIIKEKIKLPAFLSSEAHSLLKGLLCKDPSRRLGSGPLGADEIKRHKWFKPINWKKLEAREIKPSFRPDVAGKLCIANFEKCWTDMSVLDSPATTPKNNENLFADFAYVRT